MDIRSYAPPDRDAVRRISCETAFFGMNRREIFADDDLLADALTRYYTDYEPGSCFVAKEGGEVRGYVIGAVNIRHMETAFGWRMLPGLFLKSIRHGFWLRARHWRLFFSFFASFMKGEFLVPDFTRDYPATLHINIAEGLRGQHVGGALISRYLEYLQGRDVRGVHCSAMSEAARAFFLKQGFQELYHGRRSFLDRFAGQEVVYYVLGRKVS